MAQRAEQQQLGRGHRAGRALDAVLGSIRIEYPSPSRPR
jgi:hypothetical protein